MLHFPIINEEGRSFQLNEKERKRGDWMEYITGNQHGTTLDRKNMK